MLLGDDFLPLMVAALGGALFVGNGLALLRPPKKTKEGDLERAPIGRSVVMATLGLIVAVWALVSLLA